MNLQAIELARVAHRHPLSGIRWNAIAGGVCVGLAAYVLLMLLGICAGMALGGHSADSTDVSGAALAWNLVSALTAATLGAFITARAADLRRPSDGVIHGLVVWGAATVVAALFALVMLRDVAGGMLLVMAHQQADKTATAQMERGEPWRNGTFNVIQTGANERSDLPRRAANDGWQRLPMAAEAPAGAPAQMALPAYASLMLCAALVMAMFGGIAGGLLGTQRPRRADPLDQSNWRDVVEHLDI